MPILLILLLLQAPPAPPFQPGLRVDAPRTFVAFAAELKITNPNRPEAFGRFLQDEHGCTRRETVHPDGSLMVTINNFTTERGYTLMRGNWSSQAMRLVPGIPRQPRTQRVQKKAPPIEGFDAYITSTTVRSPKGDYALDQTVIPALNFFTAIQTLPTGDTITAQNIRLGSSDHAEFLPPEGSAIAEQPGVGGHMQFSAVVIRVNFPDRAALELTTTEEQPVGVRLPVTGERVQLVTTVVDDVRNLVRVRVMKNPTLKGRGNVEGEVLDEVIVALGGTVATTKLLENFDVSVTRIRDKRIGR